MSKTKPYTEVLTKKPRIKKSEIIGFCPSCFSRLDIFDHDDWKYLNRKCTLCSWRGNHKDALINKPKKYRITDEKYRITDEKLEQMHNDFSKLVQPEKIIVKLVEDLRDARKELKKKNT